MAFIMPERTATAWPAMKRENLRIQGRAKGHGPHKQAGIHQEEHYA
jgi:hypothetical protein